MRRTKELHWRRYLLSGVAAISMVFLLAFLPDAFSIVSHAESAAKVTAASANIRKEPSASSETIGSTEKDKVISIRSQVTGSDGYTWYEVYVDAETLGYIRSDLVQITDGTTPPAGTGTASGGTGTASGGTGTASGGTGTTPVPDEPLVAVTAVNPAEASVTGGDSVRIRQNASTTSRIINTTQTGKVLTITGKADGTDGRVWYQVIFIADGVETTGFIRSDYTTVKPDELTDITEEPPAEEPPVEGTPVEDPSVGEPSEPATGTEGYGTVLQDGQWMLIDYEGKHTDNPGEGFSIETLINGLEQNAEMYEESEKAVKTQKIVIILLVILLVGAAAAITLLIFKVKDMSDAQYFNEVENETLRHRGTRPQGSSQRVMQTVGSGKQAGRPAGASQGQRPQGNRPTGAPQGQRPQGQRPQGSRPVGSSQSHVQRSQGSRPAGTPQAARPAGTQSPQSQTIQNQQRPASQGARHSGMSQSQPRPAAQGQRPMGNRPAQGQQSPGWQAKNFMADEDEFEFEFLNYDGDEQK